MHSIKLLPRTVISTYSPIRNIGEYLFPGTSSHQPCWIIKETQRSSCLRFCCYKNAKLFIENVRAKEISFLSSD